MPQFAQWSGWPSRRAWGVFFKCGLLLSLEWIVVYGGTNWIAGLHKYRVRLDIAIEREIPFVPAAVVIYLSLFPLLWLAPFVLQLPGRLKSFAEALALLIALSGIGFLIVPSQQTESLPGVVGVLGSVFRFADWINLTYNYLPSLHVGMAVVCAYAYSRVVSPKTGLLFWLWASAIAVSTLLIHQHYVADVAAGSVLGLLIAANVMEDSI